MPEETTSLLASMPAGSTFHDLLQSFLERCKPATTGFSREVEEMLGVIHKELFEPSFSVETLKARCRIRDNNVSSRFRLATGIPLKAYMQHLRMEAAGLLLREHSAAVVDISTAIGFSHPQGFYRLFQKHYRCTPAEYRRRSMDS